MRDAVQIKLNEQAVVIKELRKQLGDVIDQSAMLAVALKSVAPYVRASERKGDFTFERASGLMERALAKYAEGK